MNPNKILKNAADGDRPFSLHRLFVDFATGDKMVADGYAAAFERGDGPTNTIRPGQFDVPVNVDQALFEQIKAGTMKPCEATAAFTAYFRLDILLDALSALSDEKCVVRLDFHPIFERGVLCYALGASQCNDAAVAMGNLHVCKDPEREFFRPWLKESAQQQDSESTEPETKA